MDFTNINDPAGVSALLSQLRSSQAWANLQANPGPIDQAQSSLSLSSDDQHPVERDSQLNLSEKSVTQINSSDNGVSVASLLSQLRPTAEASSGRSNSEASYVPTPAPRLQGLGSSALKDGRVDNPTLVAPRSVKSKQNVRNMTFQQALPVLARMSEDSACIEVLTRLKKEQETLERHLWDERQKIIEGQEAKVKTAITRANMLSTPITPREANTMTLSFTKELEQFDKNRVFAAWEGLIVKQQNALETAGVPTMYVSSLQTDRERQKRVMQVLEGIVHSE